MVPVDRRWGELRVTLRSQVAWLPAFAIVHASDVFLPWGRPRAGRIASGSISYYRSAEIAIALSFGLTFALVGWWDIVGSIWSALE